MVVLGAAGGIGQPLSLLLKLSPEVDELACYDIVGTPGVAADLSHVSTVLCMIACCRSLPYAVRVSCMLCGIFQHTILIFAHYRFLQRHN